MNRLILIINRWSTVAIFIDWVVAKKILFVCYKLIFVICTQMLSFTMYVIGGYWFLKKCYSLDLNLSRYRYYVFQVCFSNHYNYDSGIHVLLSKTLKQVLGEKQKICYLLLVCYVAMKLLNDDVFRRLW